MVEVEVRDRPRSLRCALAPHAAEVSIFRPESRYHRLVFTVPEWDAFLADVKTANTTWWRRRDRDRWDGARCSRVVSREKWTCFKRRGLPRGDLDRNLHEQPPSRRHLASRQVPLILFNNDSMQSWRSAAPADPAAR